MPSATNEDGHLSVEIGKKDSEVRLSQQGLVAELHKCLGSKPTLMVCIEGIKSLPENRYLLISHSLVLARRLLFFGNYPQCTKSIHVLSLSKKAKI